MLIVSPSRGESYRKKSPSASFLRTNGILLKELRPSRAYQGYKPETRQGRDGALYGTTRIGGNFGDGTVFRLIPWPAPPGLRQISRAPGQNAELSIVPTLDATSVISASSNLLAWTPLTSLPACVGPVYFTDQTFTNFPQRFYFAVWLPKCHGAIPVSLPLPGPRPKPRMARAENQGCSDGPGIRFAGRQRLQADERNARSVTFELVTG
jgi:uncharacterized repeat protein (TIGR03803 family)